jgi:hypothetical protein
MTLDIGQVSEGVYVPLLLDSAGRTLIAGTQSDGTATRVLVDSSGRSVINMAVGVLTQPLPAGTNNIGDVDIVTAPTLITAPQYDNVAMAYSGVVRESIDNLDLSSGTNLLNTSAVPSGYVWQIENIGIKYTGTVAGVTLDAQIISGALIMGLFGKAPPVSSEFEERQGCWTLAAGENLRFAVTGATAHDQARLRAVGRFFAVE